MYSILKIIQGLKLTLLLFILSAGSMIINERSASVEFENPGFTYDLELLNLEEYVKDPAFIIPVSESPDVDHQVKSFSKPSSLSELGLYIEL